MKIKDQKKKPFKVLTKILQLKMSSNISHLLKAEIKLEIEKSRIKLEKEITQSKKYIKKVKTEKKTKTKYKRSLKIENPENNQCSFCPYMAKQRKNLDVHIDKIHEKIWRYKCSKCDFSSYGHNQVQDHQRRRHVDEKEVKVVPITCEDCNNKVSHENCPRKRRIKHHGMKPENQDKEKEYKCDEAGCDVTSMTLSYLVRHKNMVHLGIQKYRCSKCDYISYERYRVQTHCKRHKDLLAVPLRIGCSLCSEKSQCDHRKKIIDEKEVKKYTPKDRKEIKKCMQKDRKEIYICKICEFLTPFNTVKLRRTHYIQIHPGKFIYNCEECNYGANYFSHLKDHRNSKHEKISLTCHQCEYTTIQRSVLLRHLREQHGMVVYGNISKEPLLCDECGYSSFSNLLFKRHNCNQKEPDGCKVNITRLSKLQRQAQCKADV